MTTTTTSTKAVSDAHGSSNIHGHTFTGEHPDHCFFAIQEGFGANSRPRYVYCGAPNEDAEAHISDQAMLAARELLELRNSLRLEPFIADISNAIRAYGPQQIQEIRRSLAILNPMVDKIDPSIFG